MTLSTTEDNPHLSVLPVGMQNSALVLEDEDGNDIIQELESLSSSQPHIAPTAINIENSSDVVIGPVTHFNGPVTIYQNVDRSRANNQNTTKKSINGKLVKSESTSSETSYPPENSSKNALWRSKEVKYLCILLIILVIIIIVTLSTTLAMNSEIPPPPPMPPKNGNTNKDDVDDKLEPVGSGNIFEKKIWGGMPALNFTKELQHPTPFVIIAHTATPACNNYLSCSARVKSMQEYHVGTLGSPDIGYNFVIGGDGNAYVGRGWDIANFHSKDSIGISFIGNYLYDSLTPEMISVAKKLLDIGVRDGKLAENYKLIGHNQTYATQSPGPNIYKVIKTWPHFDPQNYRIKP